MNATASTPATAGEQPPVLLRPLERGDLHFVHELNNNRTVMSYWFEEPYESFVELEELFRKHIHDQSERRFIVEDGSHTRVAWWSWSRSTICTGAPSSRS